MIEAKIALNPQYDVHSSLPPWFCLEGSDVPSVRANSPEWHHPPLEEDQFAPITGGERGNIKKD
jgi:hypothetical protein